MNSVDRRQAIVVGTGPAGSRAALALAREGIDVLSVERKPRPGTPVRCGEGIGSRGLEATGLPIRKEWIASKIDDLLFYSPSGTPVRVSSKSPAYILNREVFDFDLAQIAQKAGAGLLLDTTVQQIRREKGRWQLYCTGPSGEKELECELLIAADGVEGRMGRQAGLCPGLSMRDIESCVQYCMDGIEVENACHFFAGEKSSPGGYAWVFPKGEDKANVGLGILGKHGSRAKPTVLLDRFVQSHFPRARIISRTVGGVPVGRLPKRIECDGLMLAGDAAHQVNCLNGGGLSYALAAGNLAGKTGAFGLLQKDVSAGALREYRKAWDSKLGKQQVRSFHLKEAMLMLKDEEMNAVAERLSNTPDKDTFSLVGLFGRVFWKHPTLMWKAFKLLS